MHRETKHCDAQTEFFEWTSLQPFHGGDVVTCFDLVGCRERWSNAVGCEVTWGEVMWLVARCHVMWCVTSRDAMRCHVMCSHVMSCLLWSDAVQWDAISWVYDEMWLVAMSRCVVRVVVSCDELEDELVIRSTKYCKFYTVLQGATKYYFSVLQDTTQYYKVLLQY